MAYASADGMHCCAKLKHAVLTSISVISLFYLIDLVFLEYSDALRSADPRLTQLAAALEEAAAARNANAPMIRLENSEATLREIVDSHRQGAQHADSNLLYYGYKLGLEEHYWENKMIANIVLEKTNRLNKEQVDLDDGRLVDLVRDYWIHPPSVEPYQLLAPQLTDFSMGQSPVVDTILKGKTGGFFVECGALDGETRSNTLFFERERNWTGLLIEAGPGNYRQLLSKHRRAWMSPTCLGVDAYPTSMLFHKGRNRGRLLESKEAFDWVTDQRMTLSVATVQCFPLYAFLLALNRTHVDYLSLDVEGLELEVLQTIPFDLVTISVLTVEFQHAAAGREGLVEFMEDKDYEVVGQISRSDGLANDLIFARPYDLMSSK